MRSIVRMLFFLVLVFPAKAQQVKLLWPNGKIKEEGNTKSGYKDGKWEDFYESGKVKSKGKYKKGKFGLYDGELNGFYENGKKWYHILYASEERTEIAEEWDPEGKLLRTIRTTFITKPALSFKMICVSGTDSSFVDMETQKIHWVSTGKKPIVYDLRASTKELKKQRKQEVIKTLLFESAEFNSSQLLKQLSLFYDKLQWEGNVKVLDEKHRTISDTTYIDDLPRYSFQYIYMSDTLAYSRTVMDQKTYYIFPSSYEKGVYFKLLGKKSREYTERYPDFMVLPASFPDGTWLFLYSKDKEQFNNEGNDILRTRVNDTTYQYSFANIVSLSQDFNDHKPNGAYHTYYIYSDPSQYLNRKFTIKTNKFKALQFNIEQEYGLYVNGRKNGVFYRFLLDGKTERSCQTFVNNQQNGITIYNLFNDSNWNELIPPFMSYSELYPTVDTSLKVNIDNPRWGAFKMYVFSIVNSWDQYGKKGDYVSLKESFITHAPIGIDLEIEDTVTNLSNVVARNKAKCKYYSEIFHDANGTITKYQVFRYGKLKQYGTCKPSPVWTQDPEKIKEEEYDDNGNLIERSTFDYNSKTVTITTYKKGQVVKVEKGPLM